MSDFVNVYQTTGAVGIAVDDDYVSIEQQSTMGDAAQVIAIPRPLFKEVLNTIFADLMPHELKEIAELAEVHAKPTREG